MNDNRVHSGSSAEGPHCVLYPTACVPTHGFASASGLVPTACNDDESRATLAASYRLACRAALDEIAAQAVHERIAAMLRQYRSMIPTDRLPGRQHFDPVDVRALLPNVWLIDAVGGAQQRFRYRLLGTRIAKMLTIEGTGRFLDEVHAGFADSPVHTALLDVLSTRRASYRAGRPLAWPTDSLQSLERLYLPLARNGIDVDMILGFTVFTLKDGSEF